MNGTYSSPGWAICSGRQKPRVSDFPPRPGRRAWIFSPFAFLLPVGSEPSPEVFFGFWSGGVSIWPAFAQRWSLSAGLARETKWPRLRGRFGETRGPRCPWLSWSKNRLVDLVDLVVLVVLVDLVDLVVLVVLVDLVDLIDLVGLVDLVDLPWFSWWFHQLQGRPIYFQPTRTPMPEGSRGDLIRQDKDPQEAPGEGEVQAVAEERLGTGGEGGVVVWAERLGGFGENYGKELTIRRKPSKKQVT